MRIILAYCSNCEVATEMERQDNGRDGRCTECGTLQIMTENPKVFKQMREVSIAMQSHFSDFLMAREKYESLRRMLNPIEVQPKPAWERLTVEVACGACGRRTRYALKGIPRCQGECKPRKTSGKVGYDDMPEELKAMLDELADGVNDDKDFEVMKFKTPEAS